MKRFLFVGFLFMLVTCAKEIPTYDVTFTTDVMLDTLTADSCSSVFIQATAVVQESVEIDQKGILVSLCPSPELTDPNEDDNSCVERPDIYVTDSSTTTYSFQIYGLVNSGIPYLEQGRTYYTRPFAVIQNVPYYGKTVDFECQ